VNADTFSARPLLGLARFDGQRLEQQHPSFAHLAFVATIEGFGTRFVNDVLYDYRPGCTHRKNAAQKRFRKPLKTVMTNRKVEKSWEIACTLRSPTGHSGTLFGLRRADQPARARPEAAGHHRRLARRPAPAHLRQAGHTSRLITRALAKAQPDGDLSPGLQRSAPRSSGLDPWG
jgi:hypothetical protein